MFQKSNFKPMKKFFFALWMLFAVSVIAVACTKVEEQSPPEQVYQEMIQKYSGHVPDEGVEEAMTLTAAQFDELANAQTLWPREVLAMVLPVEGNRNRPVTYQERLQILRSHLPDTRTEDASTVETWIRRQNAPAMFDATSDVVAQVFAAMGTTVGQKSSLNLWKPVNDTGAVTFHDGARAVSALNQTGNFDFYAEYLPESVVFEFEVSGGNWLIGATVIRNNATGLMPDTVQFGFNSPNGPLIWNPTLSSPADDDWIEGPIHPQYGITAISANGLVPPPSPV
jgi:hypothetical protein